MHPFQLPADVVARVTARRGRPFAFPTLDVKRTALVVIDMQNAFLAPGAAGEVPLAREIVPNINRIAAVLRRAGGTVAWVQVGITPGLPGGGWPVLYGEIFNPALADKYLAGLTPGSEGYALWPELETRQGDLIVHKTRFSAFLHGTCDLPEQLEKRGIDTVIITGTLTNVCCESSARDAMMRGFRVIMVSDANATRTDAEHMASLVAIHQVFGDVRHTEDLVRLIYE